MEQYFSEIKSQLEVNEEEIIKDFKSAASVYDFENNLGRFLRVAALVAFSLTFFFEILRGKLILASLFDPNDLSPGILLMTLAASVYAFGMYLERDKDKYQDLTHKSLYELDKKIADIRKTHALVHVEEYLSQDLLQILGRYFSSPLAGDAAEITLLSELWKYPNNKALMSRLGLNEANQELLLQKIVTQKPTWESINFKEYLKQAFLVAYRNKFPYLDPMALLLYFFQYEYTNALNTFDISSGHVSALGDWMLAQHYKKQLFENARSNSLFKPKTQVNAAMTSVYSPTLEKYTDDLTQTAQALLSKANINAFEISLRRDKLFQIIRILDSEEGLALLVGPPGVGKSKIIETISYMFIAEDLPSNLKDMRLLELNVSKLMGDLKSPEEISLNMQNILREQELSGNIVLVIDDIDQILNVRDEVQKELVSMLAVELNKVKVKLLATITQENYQRFMSNIQQLDALFEKLELDAPHPNLTLQILIDELTVLESKYKVKVDFKALQRVVELAPQYDFNKSLPAKAISLLSDVCQFVKEKDLNFVDINSVDDLFTAKMGFQVGIGSKTLATEITDEDKEKFAHLEDEIGKSMIGQREAVVAIANSLRRARAGLNSENKPIASFLFFGPTGVGKTHLAQTIARVYFGDEKLFLRLDMSEYQENKNLGKLLGERSEAAVEDGILTKFVLTHPYSVILLDELEKANPRVLDIFLQVLDNASILDGAGRRVSFENTIIIATSNAGSNLIAKLAEAGNSYKQIQPLALEELKKSFKVEFLNRFNGVIMFSMLNQLEAREIVKLLLFEQKEKLAEKGIEFVFGDQLIDRVIAQGYSKQYGARELKRAISSLIEDRVATAIIAGQLKAGDIFSLD